MMSWMTASGIALVATPPVSAERRGRTVGPNATLIFEVELPAIK